MWEITPGKTACRQRSRKQSEVSTKSGRDGLFSLAMWSSIPREDFRTTVGTSHCCGSLFAWPISHGCQNFVASPLYSSLLLFCRVEFIDNWHGDRMRPSSGSETNHRTVQRWVLSNRRQ